MNCVSKATQRYLFPRELNPFTPEYFAMENPYPLLGELHAIGPVVWVNAAHDQVITAYKPAADGLMTPQPRAVFNRSAKVGLLQEVCRQDQPARQDMFASRPPASRPHVS